MPRDSAQRDKREYITTHRILEKRLPTDVEVHPDRKELYLVATIDPPLHSCNEITLLRAEYEQTDELSLDLVKSPILLQNGVLLRLLRSFPGDALGVRCPSCKSGYGVQKISREHLRVVWKCESCQYATTAIRAAAEGIAGDVFGSYSADREVGIDLVQHGIRQSLLYIPGLYKVLRVHATGCIFKEKSALELGTLGHYIRSGREFQPPSQRNWGPIVLFNMFHESRRRNIDKAIGYYSLFVGYNLESEAKLATQGYERYLMLAKEHQLKGMFSEAILEANLSVELATNAALRAILRTTFARTRECENAVEWMKPRMKRKILLFDLVPLPAVFKDDTILRDIEKLEKWRHKIAHGARWDFSNDEAKTAIRAAAYFILHLCAALSEFPNSLFVED